MRFAGIKLALFFCFFSSFRALAQGSWPSPEVEQMYHNAQDYVMRGNYKDAITTYRQAILLAPTSIDLHKGLGQSLYRSGSYKEAEKELSPLLSQPAADAECFALLAQSQAAQGAGKHARATLQQGLAKFPASGLLYNEAGKLAFTQKKPGDALAYWRSGISSDPAYATNYLSAANVYLNTDNVLWGLLYGEIYLAMAHDSTSGDDQLKAAIFTGYSKFFTAIGNNTSPETKPVSDFEAAVTDIYTSLTPVISDGITTENLTMVRTRFLMDWDRQYGKQFPFPLFAYQHNLVRKGYFDQYNEWLFGKAENANEYDAWNKFHKGDMAAIDEWLRANPLVPAANDAKSGR